MKEIKEKFKSTKLVQLSEKNLNDIEIVKQKTGIVNISDLMRYSLSYTAEGVSK